MSAREITVELEHLRLAGLEWGPADGEPVLAIHGWLDNAASFSLLAPRLDGLRIIALDLAGHGRSDHRPAACNHHFVDWVPQIIEAADVLELERFSLLGHSMGAGISSVVPSAAPGRVSKMVLLEGAGPLAMDAGDAPALLRSALKDERRVATSPVKLHPDLAAAVAARRQGTDLDPASARILVERSVKETSDGCRFIFDPRLKSRSRSRFTEDQVLAFLAAVDCPVLAVRALSGWPFPEQLMQRRLDTIPDLTRVELEGGHHVHLTHPERVAPPILEFFGLSRTANNAELKTKN
ncbi:MAG: alpha/beta hydrolase [Thermoanaerobaculales bacterium]|jgi:pimeloyl-ACP methyl ester carboxylesterase|nr:alpha/beta hydrolase [Thermoanaerobaculales bacterium]